MTSHISRPAYGTDFFHNFDKFWTDFLQFSAKDGGRCHNRHTPPNVRPWAGLDINILCQVPIIILLAK